jgi:hypothetical protein
MQQRYADSDISILMLDMMDSTPRKRWWFSKDGNERDEAVRAADLRGSDLKTRRWRIQILPQIPQTDGST